jgi:hypothetical protein
VSGAKPRVVYGERDSRLVEQRQWAELLEAVSRRNPETEVQNERYLEAFKSWASARPEDTGRGERKGDARGE